MKRWLRRLSVLGLLGGAVGWFVKSRRPAGASAASDAAWPPLRLVDPPTPKSESVSESMSSSVSDATVHAFVSTPTADTGWIEPVRGVCPATHPIKANDQSKIFHVPGGRSYERTIPERCYSSGDAATADGYRQAKV